MKLQIGPVSYEIDSGQIEKILPNPAVVPVPRASELIVGLLYYQGTPVPVFLPEPGADGGRTGRLAVVMRGADGGFKAFLADEIAGEDGVEEGGIGTIH